MAEMNMAQVDPMELELFIEHKLDPACEGAKIPVAIAGMLIKCALGLNPNLTETQLATIFLSASEHLAMMVATADASTTVH